MLGAPPSVHIFVVADDFDVADHLLREADRLDSLVADFLVQSTCGCARDFLKDGMHWFLDGQYSSLLKICLSSGEKWRCTTTTFHTRFPIIRVG